MFHFPHMISVHEKPSGSGAYGEPVYKTCGTNIRCQFMGLPLEVLRFRQFGEVSHVDGVFSILAEEDVEPGDRLVFNKVGYVVDQVQPAMEMSGSHIYSFVSVRKQKIRDGATKYTATV